MSRRLERFATLAGGIFTPGMGPTISEAMKPQPRLKAHNPKKLPEMLQVGVQINTLLEEWDGKSGRSSEQNLNFLDRFGTIFSDAVHNQPDKKFMAKTKPKIRKMWKKRRLKEFWTLMEGKETSPANTYRIFDRVDFRHQDGSLVLLHEESTTKSLRPPGGIIEELRFYPSEENGKFKRFSGDFTINTGGYNQREPGSFYFERDNVNQAQAQKAAELTYRFARTVAELLK